MIRHVIGEGYTSYLYVGEWSTSELIGDVLYPMPSYQQQ